MLGVFGRRRKLMGGLLGVAGWSATPIACPEGTGNKYFGRGPGGGFGIRGPNMPHLARSRRGGAGGDRSVFHHSLI